MKLQAQTVPKKNNGFVDEMKSKWQLYLMLLLPVVYIIIFAYGPMYGAQIAFKDFVPSKGITGSSWVGMKHFKAFFESYQFRRVLKNTLVISIYSLIAGFPISVLLALMLNTTRQKAYKKTVQMLTYMPHFISLVVLVGIINQMLNMKIGLYGIMCQKLGITPVDILSSSKAFPHLYVWTGVWQNMGWSTIIYLSALAGVDVQLHEAAIMDGATMLKRIIHIDLPAIVPTMIIILIMNAGSIMGVGFEKVYLMQNDLNLTTSEVISTYVYKVGIVSSTGNYSYATAIGLFNSVVNLILLATVNYIASRVGETSLW